MGFIKSLEIIRNKLQITNRPTVLKGKNPTDVVKQHFVNGIARAKCDFYSRHQ